MALLQARWEQTIMWLVSGTIRKDICRRLLMREIAQTQCSRDLIDSASIYVDKTEQIFSLMDSRRAFIS